MRYASNLPHSFLLGWSCRAWIRLLSLNHEEKELGNVPATRIAYSCLPFGEKSLWRPDYGAWKSERMNKRPVEAVGPSGVADSFLSSAKHLMGDTGPSATSPLKKEKAEKSQAASKHTEIKEKKKKGQSKSHSLCGHFGIYHPVPHEV